MIAKLIFKTPDVLDQLSLQERTPEIAELVGQYVKYGELITIEFDTESNSARVKELH